MFVVSALEAAAILAKVDAFVVEARDELNSHYVLLVGKDGPNDEWLKRTPVLTEAKLEPAGKVVALSSVVTVQAISAGMAELTYMPNSFWTEADRDLKKKVHFFMDLTDCTGKDIRWPADSEMPAVHSIVALPESLRDPIGDVLAESTPRVKF